MKFKGLELKDAGYTPEKETGLVKSEVMDDPKIKYAKLYVDDREIPAIADKEFGDECIMIALVKVDRKSIEEVEEKGKKKTRISANFDILKASFVPYKEQKPDEMNDEELNNEIEDKGTPIGK